MGIGLYTHTFRSTGTLLTANVYDNDHEEHVVGNDPTLTDDYSEDVAQMQLTTDPGGVGSESLATEFGGELERVRFVVAEIAGYANNNVSVAEWYVPVAAPVRPAIAARAFRHTNLTTVANVEAIVTWAGVLYDTAAFWSAGHPTRMTAPRTGVYHIGASIEITGTVNDTDNKFFVTYFKVNGGTTTTPGLVANNGSEGLRFVTLNAEFALGAGSYLELAFTQNIAASLNVLQNPNLSLHMWMSLVGLLT